MLPPECRPTICFSVRALADPGMMPRVLEQFARRGIVPGRWHSSVGGPSGEALAIDMEMAGLAPETAVRLAANLTGKGSSGSIPTFGAVGSNVEKN